MSKYWSKLRCLKGGWVIERKPQGEGDRPPTNFDVRKIGPWAITWCHLRDPTLAVLIQYRRVTHTHTHTRTRDHGYYPRG